MLPDKDSKWQIVEYVTSRGERPIANFIKSLPPPIAAKVIHHIDIV